MSCFLVCAFERNVVKSGLFARRRAPIFSLRGFSPMFKILKRTAKPEPETLAQLGRNEPCWCGSGKKYKQCHMVKDQPKK